MGPKYDEDGFEIPQDSSDVQHDVLNGSLWESPNQPGVYYDGDGVEYDGDYNRLYSD